MPQTTRHVQILPLICAVCHLTMAFPIQAPYAHDDVQELQLNIPVSGPILTPLGSSISIPCLVSLSSTSFSSPSVVPRVKWTVVSGEVETEILVARSSRVKINEAYRDRAALLNYTSSTEDVSLWLGDLRHSDSGYYRCEVQQGLEDAMKVVQVKVKGVVFHYRDALGRYSFSFQQAQRACEGIGAKVATPDQLLAAYFDGYEQCDAGWLADQSVRYPIQVPREGCYGDMDGQPGVRNYGTMDPDDLFDVYCYIEQIEGRVFYDPVPQQLSFDDAQSYCRAAGAQLATTAQLYSAWSEGLDRCSPGWLSDGSVRYPIVTPRERCGGPHPGVKTLYRFSNQTGFPEPSSLHDVYCFRGHVDTSIDSPVDHLVTEAEDLEVNVVILQQRDQELHLNQLEKQVEREAQSELESLPLLPDSFATEYPVDTNQTVTSDRTGSFPSTTPALDLHQPRNETVGRSYNSELLTEPINSTINTTDIHDSTQNTTSLAGDYNGTEFNQNLSLTFHLSELERSTYQPQTESQTVPDTNPTESLQSIQEVKPYQEGQETGLMFDISHTNDSEAQNNHTDVDAEEGFWEGTTLTVGSLTQVKLEDPASEDPLQMSVTTQVSQNKGTPPSQETPTTESAIETYSIWTPVDASGDISQEKESEREVVTFISASQSSAAGLTAQPLGSAVASTAPTTPQRAAPSPTLSSVSRHVDKLGFETLSTTSGLLELTISRQEGSTSLEDMEEKQVDAAQPPTQVVSDISLPITESPEDMNNSYSPSKFATEQYQTLGYEVPVGTTNFYEEASGYDLETTTSIFQEDISMTLGKNVNRSILNEKEATIPSTVLVIEEEKGDQSTEKESKVAPTLIAGETKVTPTVVLAEETKVSPTTATTTLVLEEEANVDPTAFLKEETKVSPTLSLKEVKVVTVLAIETEEAKVTPTAVLEEEEEEEAKSIPTLFVDGENRVDPNVAEEAKVTPTLVIDEESNVDPTNFLEQETKVSPTLVLDEVKVAPVLVVEEEEVKVTPKSVIEEEEEVKVTPTLVIDEEANVDPTNFQEEETKVSPTLVIDEVKVAPVLVVEEEVKVTPKGVLEEEEAKVTPTLIIDEVANVDPTVAEEPKVASTLVLEARVVTEDKVKVTPKVIVQEKAKVDSVQLNFISTVTEEAKVAPTLIYGKNKATPNPLLEEEANVQNSEETNILSGFPEGESKVVPTLVAEELKVSPALDFEEETDVGPTVEDFTIFPLISQTSMWSLPTTTSGPQEHLNSKKVSQKPPFLSVSSTPRKTKSTSSSPTMTTPTHVPKRTWSPRTTRPPHIYHKMTEPQKMNHFMPPLDHGVVDLEISLTPPPTLLILPKERAAVGGTGAFSDACLDDPCLNGGTCTERDGHIKCLCLPTYGGDVCQTDLERCDPGWDKFHGFCYRHFSQRQSWEVAERHCRTQGAHLVSIMTPEEQDYINSNYKEYQWTGLNDKTVEDDFRWSDGNPLLYVNWYRGQPDSYFLSGEDCVVMVWHDNGRWSDVPCNYHLAYTCKKGTSSCGPPPKVRNASIFGKARSRYETSAVVRYHCSEGFQQRLNPLVRCLPGGRWERPQIICIPEGGEIMQNLGMLPQTDSDFLAAETESEATEETPQFWDIKF